VSYEDNAAGEGGIGGLVVSPEEEAFLESLLYGGDTPVEGSSAEEAVGSVLP